jgi:hypothetical protein
MKMRTFLAASAMLLIATPALAGHCPKDAAAIDHALTALKVSDDVKSDVKALRDKGMALHKAGKHRESEHALAEGMRKLLMSVK